MEASGKCALLSLEQSHIRPVRTQNFHLLLRLLLAVSKLEEKNVYLFRLDRYSLSKSGVHWEGDCISFFS